MKYIILILFGALATSCSSYMPIDRFDVDVQKGVQTISRLFKTQEQLDEQEDMIRLAGVCDGAISGINSQASLGFIPRKDREKHAKEASLFFLNNADSIAAHKLKKMYEKNHWNQLNLE